MRPIAPAGRPRPAGRRLQARGDRLRGVPDGLRNADALALREAGTVDVPYEIVNPYAFAPPIAPHLAAREVGVAIGPEPIVRAFNTLSARVDAVVVEGAGGWRVPLGTTGTWPIWQQRSTCP